MFQGVPLFPGLRATGLVGRVVNAAFQLLFWISLAISYLVQVQKQKHYVASHLPRRKKI
jgi:hypothetical protein